ncbi:hypothetical protein DFH11DRAFT_1189469 [Phellopilus nigrolimitatus]|nr:hypothetical protein DFH11DRAFT_1189469 [Phellopilus nigrolimitatus]
MQKKTKGEEALAACSRCSRASQPRAPRALHARRGCVHAWRRARTCTAWVSTSRPSPGSAPRRCMCSFSASPPRRRRRAIRSGTRRTCSRQCSSRNGARTAPARREAPRARGTAAGYWAPRPRTHSRIRGWRLFALRRCARRSRRAAARRIRRLGLRWGWGCAVVLLRPGAARWGGHIRPPRPPDASRYRAGVLARAVGDAARLVCAWDGVQSRLGARLGTGRERSVSQHVARSRRRKSLPTLRARAPRR